MTRLKRFARDRTRGLLIAAVAAIGLVAGALAYWVGPGSGTATTIVPSPEQLVVGEGTPQASLAPGRDASVALVTTNPNPYFVTIDALDLDTTAEDGVAGFEVDTGHSGCDLSALHFVPQPPPIGIFGPGWRVPPKVADTDGVLAIELAGALTMDADADNACQGADFTVHLVATD